MEIRSVLGVNVLGLGLGLLTASGCPSPSSGPGDDPGTSADPSATDAMPTGPSTTTIGPATAGANGTGSTSAEGPATFGLEGPAPQLCPPGVEPAIELGHGVEVFTPLDSGPAQVYFGHQGGHHVTLGMHGFGLDLADWGEGHLRATVGGQVVADHPTVVVMTCDDGGSFSEALWINLIFEGDPRPLLGQTASVEAEYIDASGMVAVAIAELTISDTIEPL